MAQQSGGARAMVWTSCSPMRWAVCQTRTYLQTFDESDSLGRLGLQREPNHQPRRAELHARTSPGPSAREGPSHLRRAELAGMVFRGPRVRGAVGPNPPVQMARRSMVSRGWNRERVSLRKKGGGPRRVGRTVNRCSLVAPRRPSEGLLPDEREGSRESGPDGRIGVAQNFGQRRPRAASASTRHPLSGRRRTSFCQSDVRPPT
jgi:hypothetical protein